MTIFLEYFYIVSQEGNKHNFEIYNLISVICACANALITANLSFFKIAN